MFSTTRMNGRMPRRFYQQFGFLVCMFLSSLGAMGEEPAEFPEPDFDNITSATLFLKGPSEIQNAPLLDTAVDIAVSGMIANIKLTQSFDNTSAEWVEGLYTFPLPDNAAVNSLVVTIGQRKIVGSIQEKKHAEKKYEEAKNAGQVASLVKQHRPNLFSSKFANIPPGEKVSIELGYIQTVPYDNHIYRLRVPLTITPRYSPSAHSVEPEVTPPQVGLPVESSPVEFRHRVNINTTLHGIYDESEVQSPSHGLVLSATDTETVVQLERIAYLDRDFILQWQDAAQSVPTVQAWREKVAGEEYFLASITPPVIEEDIPQQARELILIIDTSGSMAGEPMRAAKAALLDALQGLEPEDHFNIIEFDTDFRTLFKRPQVASDNNIDKARIFTQKLIADGGTEMLSALQTALRYRDTELLRQVVFITDGAVGYEDNVFASAREHLGDARLFTVGIGSAPNQWFMRKLAQTGRGSSQFIQNIDDVQSGMSVLLNKLETPVLTDVIVKFDGKTPDITPHLIPDLYANEPLVIAARLSKDNSTMSVEGTWGSERWRTQVLIGTAPMTNTGLSSVWARGKIESLQDEQRFSSDPELYRSLILRLSLDHQILSPYTAFLAIEEEPIRSENENLVKKNVPNLIPTGTDTQAFSLPQGSAGMDTLMLLSVLLMMMAILLLTWQRLFPATQRCFSAERYSNE